MGETNQTYSEKLKDPRWQQRRLKVFERDNWACICCCDTKSTLNVHHKRYYGNPWDCPEEYLVTLCEDCHKIISDHSIDIDTDTPKTFTHNCFKIHTNGIITILLFLHIDGLIFGVKYGREQVKTIEINNEDAKYLIHLVINNWLQWGNNELLTENLMKTHE